jgi:hypothetical protein
VEGVQACHPEVEGKEELYLVRVWPWIDKIRSRNQVLLKLVQIFCAFDAEKYQPQEDGQQQEAHQPPALVRLRAVHRQGHAQAAADEHCRVNAAEPDVQMVARLAIYRIPQKEAAEEHDLSEQKSPHAKAVGRVLLRHVIELMGYGGATLSQRRPPFP